MNFLEKDLEQIIYDADKELLAKKGLRVNGKLLRQVRIGTYGVADLISIERPILNQTNGLDRKGMITIYELKKESVSVSSYIQAIGYAKGVMRWMELHPRKINCLDIYNYDINIVLVGKKIDTTSNFIFINDFYPPNFNNDMHSMPCISVEMFTYKYDIDGIRFDQHREYIKTSEGFKYE